MKNYGKSDYADPAGNFAEMVVGVSYEDFPQEALDLAKIAIFDTLSIMIAGSSWDISPVVADVSKEWGGPGSSQILIYGDYAPPVVASFVNGVMARAIDMGDNHSTGCHTSEWNVPTMFALLQSLDRPISGKEFLATYVASAEVGIRIFTATDVAKHCAFGMPGEFQGAYTATAAASRLLGLTQEQMWNAFGIAYSTHGFSEFQKHTEGAQMVRGQHGFVGDTAIKAATLAQLGVTGPKNIFLGSPGGVFKHLPWQDGTDPGVLTQDLGLRWYYHEDLSLKPYPSCKFTHSFIETVIAMRQEHQFNPDEIAQIVGYGNPGVTMVSEPAAKKRRPTNVAEAQFSAYYTVACAALTGDVFLNSYAAEELHDSKKVALMDRIHIETDANIVEPFEGFRVEIHMKDGSVLKGHTPYVRGHVNNPMTWADLEEKFRKCLRFSARELPRAEEIIELCRNMEAIGDMRVILECLVPAKVGAA